jgi:hypothetical protein
MYCEHCGNEINNDDKFCQKCGQPVTGVESGKGSSKQLVIICELIGIVCVVVLGVCIFAIAKSSQNKADNKKAESKYSKEASSDNNNSGKDKDGEVLSDEEETSEAVESEAETMETETMLETETTVSAIDVPVLDEIGKQRFREAFKILPIDGLEWEDDSLADYVMLEIYNAGNSVISVLDAPYVESGDGIVPVNLTYDSINKGQRASYLRCNTEDMERFLGEIYGKSYNIMQGELTHVGETARNDGGYIYEWGDGWITSFCGADVTDITKLEFIQDGVFLTTKTEYRNETLEGDVTIYNVECRWHYNPDSPLQYTRESCDVKETYVYQNSNASSSNTSSSQMTAEEIEKERLRIKDTIAAGNVEQYILPVGTDGISWARQLDYENGKLIFAYYYNSSSGDSDQRFYFKDGVMIRWVVGTSPNQIYYNISDDTLPSDWYKYEAECLNASVR